MVILCPSFSAPLPMMLTTSLPGSNIKKNYKPPNKNGHQRAVEYLKTTSPEPLVQIQNNFTYIFLKIPSTESVRVALNWES